MSKVKISGDKIYFRCPGCDSTHMINTSWKFNGDLDKPTISPSIKVTSTRNLTEEEIEKIIRGIKIEVPQTICHSFITAGQIKFCSDSTHKLAGKTLDLPEIGPENDI